MPYKDGTRITLGFNSREAETIRKLAEQANVTPYALLKAIVVNELKLKEEKSMSIYQKALALMEKKDIDNHCSDLYLRKNEISTKLVNEYEFKQNVTTFRDQIDNDIWYEIPFAYEGEQK